MSTKDISRFLLQPGKHYTGMRMQQGRVLLDSDYNEGAQHDEEDRRRTLVDLIGPQGSPDTGFFLGFAGSGDPERVKPGDQIGNIGVSFNDVGDAFVADYQLLPGSMYVGGLRFELSSFEHIAFQSDFLQAGQADMPAFSSGTFRHFFYLHGWEQCVTAVEDEEILERALGGPDTSVRVRRMRRVQFAEALEGEDCASALARVLADEFGATATFDPRTSELRSEGRLRIVFQGGESEETCAPCNPEPAGRYLGAENQAIRIMLTSPTTYVWAFDNGAPLYRVSVTGLGETPSDVTVEMLTVPKDEEHWPLEGRVVEILPWSAILENGEKVADEIGVFCRVAESYDPQSRTFKLDMNVNIAALNALIHTWPGHPRAADLNVAEGDERLFYVRFWHQAPTAADVELDAEDSDSAPPLGATGLVPRFRTPGKRGDFWIAAVRPETPNIVVPFDLQENEDGVPPHGPRHFYAPVALISGNGAADIGTVSTVEDCRLPIVPVTDTGCCTFIVGDGVHSFGQFTSIQAAVDALPPQGGRVCVRPGTYVEEIGVGGRRNVEIEGCGDRTLIVRPADATGLAVFQITASPGCRLRNLQIRTNRAALSVVQTDDFAASDLLVVEEDPIAEDAFTSLIHVGGVLGVELRALRIEALRRTGLSVAAVQDLALEGLMIRDRGTAPLSTPLVQLAAIQFGLRSSSIHAAGRPALRVEGGAQFQIEGVELRATNTTTHPTRSAFTLVSVSDGVVSNCRIFCDGVGDDAAMTIDGAGRLLVQGCLLQTSGITVYGGLHLASGGRIQILNNQILGGGGHGITLGGVLWDSADGTIQNRVEGPGKGQKRPDHVLTGDLRGGFTDVIDGTAVQFVARSVGSLQDVVISGNRIESMAGNGISALTVLGLPTGEPLLKCEDLVIESNQIKHNLIGPLFDQMPVIEDAAPVGGSANGVQFSEGLILPVLPYGGIVLSYVTRRAIIRDNTIQNNGSRGRPQATLHAIAGIFVLLGEGLVITGNNIAENGDLPDNGAVTTLIRSGLRAGIGVVHATTGLPSQVDGLADAFADTVGTAVHDCALRIANNVVRQPEGRALFAVAAGSVSIVGNFFSSRGFHGATSPTSPPDALALGDVVFVQNLGRPWEALTNEGVPPQLPTEPREAVFRAPSWTSAYLRDRLSEVYYGPTDLFFVGQGGHTQFNDNQVVYDWFVERFSTNVELSYFAVCLISLDHVGMHNNQIAFRMNRGVTEPLPKEFEIRPSDPFTTELLLSSVFTLGATVHVTGNRVSEVLESPESTYVSLLTYGILMNITAMNQTTRCIAAFSRQFSSHTSPNSNDRRWVLDEPNLVLVSHTRFGDGDRPGSPQPCWSFYEEMGLWNIVAEFTRLLMDKRT